MRFFIITWIVFSVFKVVAQTSDKGDYVNELLNKTDSETLVSDVERALTSPSHWRIVVLKKDEEIITKNLNNGLKFYDDNLFVESSALLKKYGVVIDQYREEGIWNYQSETDQLIIKFETTSEKYKILLIDDTKLVIRDENNISYLLIPKYNIDDAPRILSQNSLTAEDLKEQWKINKQIEKEKLYTLYYCENFINGYALVGIDSKYHSNDVNYGYGKILFGFIDEKSGDYAIKPIYDKAYSFSNNFALVNKDIKIENNWEFINYNGINVFEEKYLDARSFNEGFAAVKLLHNKFGFIDKKGKLICKPQYQEVGDFHNGFARVKYQNKWGYIDTTGKEIIYPQFLEVTDFSNSGFAGVATFINHHYTKYYFIDKHGNILENKKGYKWITNFTNEYAIIQEDTYYNKSYGILSLEGKTKFDSEFRNIWIFNDGLALAQKEAGRKFGYINNKLKWVIKPIFDDAGFFSEGLAKVQINSNWGFINKEGTIVINEEISKAQSELKTSPPYDDVSDFKNGLAIVKTRGRTGYIDKEGNWILKPFLIAANHFENGKAKVLLPNKRGWNFINRKGEVLFPKFY